MNDEIRLYSKKNLVQGKSFREMLDKTIKKYTNRTVEAAQVVEYFRGSSALAGARAKYIQT